jgi:hypothetical protein
MNAEQREYEYGIMWIVWWIATWEPKTSWDLIEDSVIQFVKKQLPNTIIEWMSNRNYETILEKWTHTTLSVDIHSTTQSFCGYLILSNTTFKSQNPSCVQESQFKSGWLVPTSANPCPEVKFCHIFWRKF